jgi:predicted metalloprotease with PDZ domain
MNKIAGAALLSLLVQPLSSAASDGPEPTAAWEAKIAKPKDQPFPGRMEISVDVADLDRHIVKVHEHLTGVSPDLVLLYPEWLPGNHAPSGPIDRLAGLKITAGGVPVAWTRDAINVFAFHVRAGAAKAIDVDYQYLSPTSMKVGRPEVARDVLIVEWNNVVLYPAGYFTRQIPVRTTLTLPVDWKFGSALEVEQSGGAVTTFKATSVETLIDSPVYAGRYFKRVDLDPNGVAPVHLDLFADRPEFLDTKAEQIDAHRALVQQAYKLFGAHHYAHYDFLYSLSNQVEQNGLEHQQSSEDGAEPDLFTEWNNRAASRDLLPHEYTHSWNGKFRRPADLWTPNYNVPMQNSLLWVYEGQTQYWGQVLAARSGLWTKEQALDAVAANAAFYQLQTGRQWRSLQDTTDDPIINPRRPMAWRDWQRFEDYYNESALIWLDADTLIRERSGGRRSLDDFARAFFGINDGSTTIVTYTFEDVVRTLNGVQPYDWRGFLRARLDSNGQPAFLDGLKRGGYKLVFTDTPSGYEKSRDDTRKRLNLWFSLGAEIDTKDASVVSVIWDSPAYQAQLTEGSTILAVNGTAFSPEVMRDAIRSAQSAKTPIEIIVKSNDRFRVLSVHYSGGLRYPRLELDGPTPARLDDIMSPRS